MSAKELIAISRRLSEAVSAMTFEAPVAHTYNPLAYARTPHEAFLRRYGAGHKEVILLGMNPGPFGMAQTGVPFGEIAAVRDWMSIEEPVAQPPKIHPKRPIQGFACARSEVSGRRLWGWARERFGTAEAFFSRFFVVNYCPLVFMEGETGKNRVPEKLKKAEREALFEVCDHALRETVELLRPEHVIGIGKWSRGRAEKALAGMEPAPALGHVLHPSPANPAANRGWKEQAESQLRDLGIALDD